MPNRDETGSYVIGPLYGRGFGPCRIGLCRGYGRRLGIRRSSRTIIITKEEQKKILEAELLELDKEKEEIEKRLKEIE